MPKAKFNKIGLRRRAVFAVCKIFGSQNRKMLYNDFGSPVFVLTLLTFNSQNSANSKNMPSGKTHDAITFLLAAPTFAAAFKITGSAPLALIITVAFLFGGLMFGPDLDTLSRQYTRWSVFRCLWYPYQMFFPHRSRWSHGLIFGTFLRIVYFMGAATLLSFLLTCVFAALLGERAGDLMEFTRTWILIGETVRANIGENTFLSVFIGLWIGAASHTFADIAGTFIKTGRIAEFL